MTCGIDSGCNHDCTQGRYCDGRIKKPAPAWLTPAILIVMVVMLCYVGPAIDDNGAEFSAADEAIAQQKREARAIKASKEICGINAAHQINGDTMQCLTHKGRKTSVTARVQQ